MTFKVGDRVKVIAIENGQCLPGLLGAVAEVRAPSSPYTLIRLDEPLRRSIGIEYSTLWVANTDLELIEEEPVEPVEPVNLGEYEEGDW